jgi:hypothetical protein
MCQKEFGKPEDIERARKEHQDLISKLMSGPGNSEGAMRKAEQLFGLPFWSQWNLRHKRRATREFIERLRQAYLTLLATSLRRDMEFLRTEQIKGTADVGDAVLIAEAEALLAKIGQKKSP